MKNHIAILFNQPYPSRYNLVGEEKAVFGVMDSVKAVSSALVASGYEVCLVPLLPPYENIREKIKSLKVELAFNLFEGFLDQPESEAWVPEALSESGISYTGCSSGALRLALDKARAKAAMQAVGISTPEYQLLNPETVKLFCLEYPCIVKPSCEDASHGLSEESVVEKYADLERQVTRICRNYSGDALVESFISGQEFNVTVLGNARATVLPVSEIAYSLPPDLPHILTYAAKWEPENVYFKGTRVICPARLKPAINELIQETALKIFTALLCPGYARVDMRMNVDGGVYVIEINPNPDISPGAGAALQAEAAGMTYVQFINRIVELGLSDS